MSMTNVLDDVLGDSDGEFSVHSSADEGESVREVPAPTIPPSSASYLPEGSSKAAGGSTPAATKPSKAKAAPKRKKSVAKERPRKRATAGRVLPTEEVDEDIASIHSDSSTEDAGRTEPQLMTRKKGKQAMASGSQIPPEPYIPLWSQVHDSALLDSPSVQLEWLQNVLPTAEVSQYREIAPPTVRERLVAVAVEVVRCVANEVEAFNLQRFMSETGSETARDVSKAESIQNLKDEPVNSRADAADAKRKLGELQGAYDALLKENSSLKEGKRADEKWISELEGEVALLTEEKRFFLTEGLAEIVRCILRGPEFMAWSARATKALAEAGKSSGAMLMKKKFCPSVRTKDVPWYIEGAKKIAADVMAEAQHLSFSLLNAISSRPTISVEELKALCPAAEPATVDLGLGGETDEAGVSAPSAAN